MMPKTKPEDFNEFVEIVIRKNMKLLKGFSQNEIRVECWAAVMAGMKKWDGSKGKLSSWIFTTVIGRIKDLRKMQKKRWLEEIHYVEYTEHHVEYTEHHVEHTECLN